MIIIHEHANTHIKKNMFFFNIYLCDNNIFTFDLMILIFFILFPYYYVFIFIVYNNIAKTNYYFNNTVIYFLNNFLLYKNRLLDFNFIYNNNSNHKFNSFCRLIITYLFFFALKFLL